MELVLREDLWVKFYIKSDKITIVSYTTLPTSKEHERLLTLLCKLFFIPNKISKFVDLKA
jgi:hypothetical protein